MLQTWFSDILVTNEDERCNQLRIRNYELPTHQASQNPENPEILKILIQTITKQIHQASQNQAHQAHLINHGSDKIKVQTIKKAVSKIETALCQKRWLSGFLIQCLAIF